MRRVERRDAPNYAVTEYLLRALKKPFLVPANQRKYAETAQCDWWRPEWNHSNRCGKPSIDNIGSYKIHIKKIIESYFSFVRPSMNAIVLETKTLPNSFDFVNFFNFFKIIYLLMNAVDEFAMSDCERVEDIFQKQVWFYGQANKKKKKRTQKRGLTLTPLGMSINNSLSEARTFLLIVCGRVVKLHQRLLLIFLLMSKVY